MENFSSKGSFFLNKLLLAVQPKYEKRRAVVLFSGRKDKFATDDVKAFFSQVQSLRILCLVAELHVQSVLVESRLYVPRNLASTSYEGRPDLT